MVRQSKEPRSFPELVTCAQPGKRQQHGAPWLPSLGLSPRWRQLRLRAAESGVPGLRRRVASPRLRPRPQGDTLFSPPLSLPACSTATIPAQAHWGRVREEGRDGAGPGGAGRGGAGRAEPHLRSTPPRSEALRHSGGERRRCTSATVTLYFEVELRSDRRPGTEQKTSLGFTTPPKRLSLLIGMAETALLLDLDRDTGPAKTDAGACVGVGGRTDQALLSSGILRRLPALTLAASCLEMADAGATPGLLEGSEVMQELEFRETANGFYVQTRGRVGVVGVLRAKEIAVKTNR